MRASRVLRLTIAGSVVLALAPSGIALADDPTAALPTESGARLERDSTRAAGYAARDRATGQGWIGGELTVPTLGDCANGDEGAFTGIELTRARGHGAPRNYATAGVYSMCLDGVSSHTPVFETSAEGQVPIDEVIEDGDKLDVFIARIRTGTRIEFENLTQGWYQFDTFNKLRPENASVIYRSISVEGVPLPVLDPGGAKVTGLLVNGRPLDQTEPKKWVLVDDAGNRVVKPSKIKHGTDFRFKRLADPALLIFSVAAVLP